VFFGVQLFIAKEIQSVLSDHQLQHIIVLLEDVGLASFLTLYPLEKLIFEDQVLIENRVSNGQYEFFTQTIKVGTFREERDYNNIYQKQQFWSISTLASTSELAYLRTLVHELGHHIHRILREKDKNMFQYTMTIPNYNALSQYGLQDNLEYFAECLAAYIFHRVELMLDDWLGYDMIQKALQVLNLNLKEIP
jgi:hypothetical protein